MKPGDLAIVVRSPQLKGKTALILEIIPPKGIFVTFIRCLIEGRCMKIPASWLEVISVVQSR